MVTATANNLATLGSGDIPSQNVAEVAPCSPLQEGILLSPSLYAVYWVWTCTPPSGTCIDSAKLESSWRTAALNHPIYATIFASGDANGGFSQVVLRNPVLDIQQITTNNGHATAAHVLIQRPRPRWTKLDPRHTLTICTASATGQVACRFDICHTLYDVYSLRILLNDVMTIYHGGIVRKPAPFTDVVRYIKSRTEAETTGFWDEYLKGAKPCSFPTLLLDKTGNASQDEHDAICVPRAPFDAATSFCSENGITRSVFMHIAWALVLAHFNWRDDVCFGYMGSGRDAPVDGIDRICGPMANLLISRVDLTAPLRSMLQSVAKNLKEHRKHQQTYLAPVFHKLGLGGKPLFNTMINLLRAEGKEQGLTETLAFEKELLISPHEFDLVMEGHLHPETVAITLFYRRDHISRQVAEEVSNVLCWAADFLVESVTRLGLSKDVANGTESLPTLLQCFCKYVTGNDQSDIISFWQRYLSGAEDLSGRKGRRDDLHGPKREELFLQITLEPPSDFSLKLLARLAWAILLAQENESDEVFYGSTAKRGRSALRSLPELEDSKMAVIPYRVQLSRKATVGDLLNEFQKLDNDFASHEAPGLHWLKQINSSADCFATAITFEGSGLRDDGSMEMIAHLDLCEREHKLHLLSYRNTPIQRTARRFIHILRQLCHNDNLDTTWSAVAAICEEDKKEIHSWNSTILPASNRTIPDLFDIQVRERPEAIAICAWDGSLTYDQLDKHSTSLAFHLLDQSIKPGSIVVLCFEKSLLMPISMLAVAKAGIVGLGVDPNQPQSRLESVVSESKAAAILCSRTYRDLSERLGAGKVLPLNIDTVSRMQDDGTRSLPAVSSSATLYAVFTSGSTGKPKGVLVSQGAHSAAAVCQHEPYGFDQDTRVLDFSSYAFDAAWFNLMHTVTSGGCLCVPSNSELRNDLAGCIT